MNRHITSPEGFTAAGVTCGIKESGKKDLAIFAADRDVSCALVTTRNQIIGAPVVWCRKILPRGYGKVRGMVINSGNSNVCTGPQGVKNAETMATLTAKQLECPAEKVLVASTGIIGHRLPMSKIRKGIVEAASRLGKRNDSAAVQAIMTTDTREKSALVMTEIDGKPVRVAGIVKGSGMIAPSMATMIAVITTDAAISPRILNKALKEAVHLSFNAITVDSDTSTSDTVAVLASGLAGNKTINTTTSPAYRKLVGVLLEVCSELARAVVRDGEGATKIINVTVKNARNDQDAEIAAKSVANSPLFKTAMHGCDPNWGRIAMALGKSSAKVQAEKLSIRIGTTTVFRNGQGAKFTEKKVSEYLANPDIEIVCDLGLGQGSFSALTCDLTREYITINADYTT